MVLLAKYGADVGLTDDQKQTCLHKAVYHANKAPIVSFLLEKGKHVCKTTKYKFSTDSFGSFLPQESLLISEKVLDVQLCTMLQLIVILKQLGYLLPMGRM